MRIHRIQSIAAYSHLIETDEALFMVDAGMVGHGRAILRKIRDIGRDPSELRLAIVTHGHADHFGGLAEVLDEVSGFDIVAHPAHARVVATGSVLISPGLNPYSKVYEIFARNSLPHSGLRGVGSVVGLDDGTRLDEYGLAGRIVYTTGHSTGDISLLLDDGTAFVGDAVQGRRIPGVTRPELPNMALSVDDVLASWQVLLDAGATTIYPAHGSVISADDLRPVLRKSVARRDARLTPAEQPRP
jgi:glyoxylase-like metal-dependent hydrolase (beta-lactamase superfamily II)